MHDMHVVVVLMPSFPFLSLSISSTHSHLYTHTHTHTHTQKQATEGHDDVVEFSGLEFADIADGIKGEDWVTIPPPLSWFKDKE